MGGEREDFVDSGKKSENSDVMGTVAGTVPGQRLRFHQSVGEVHFHEDNLGLKAAVPVAEWWKAWERLKSQPGRWDWTDTANDTYLIVETRILGEPPGIEAFTSLTRLIAGSNFKALNNFTKRK